MRIYLERANAIHLLTRSSLQRLRINDQSVAGRVFHVPHPSYFGEHAGEYQLPRDQAAARKELGRRVDEFAVGIVGRISDRKNVELLLSATAHLLQQPMEWQEFLRSISVAIFVQNLPRGLFEGLMSSAM